VSSFPETCPICQKQLQSPAVLARLGTAKCPGCGHRVAVHELQGISTLDYHSQYDQGAFLDALRVTRQRQARVIIQALKRAIPDCDQVLDYGAGRGWFLDACRDAGMRDVAAADTSALAVDAAKAKGMAGLLVNADGNGLDFGTLPFKPRVLTLLDVIEHFPPVELGSRITAILGALPSLQVVVVKVPVSSGPLYAGAALIARIDPRALQQLYQVGTNPPHYSYFSRTSLRRLLSECGLSQLEAFGDLDFEPRLLPERVHLLRRLPQAVKSPLSWLSVAACHLLPGRDSIISVSATNARPRQSESQD
jgi:transcription elongation factor Elf1